MKNISIKTGLRWMIFSNFLVFALPIYYMFKYSYMDIILVFLAILGVIKFTLTITLSIITQNKKDE